MEPSNFQNGSPQQPAASPEPSSTRPNPFNDSQITSRKRQRTSRSVESAERRSSASSSSVTLTEDDDVDMDGVPTTPKTPEGSTGSDRRPPETSSSNKAVTINLRKARSVSPSRSMSLEEQDLAQLITATGQPALLSTGTPDAPRESPQIEVIDDDSCEDEDEVQYISTQPLSYDLTREFPYRQPDEPAINTLHRLYNHLQNMRPEDDNVVVQSVEGWLRDAADHLLTPHGPQQHTADIVRMDPEFWVLLGDLVNHMVNRKGGPLHRWDAFRETTMSSYRLAGYLTMVMLNLDTRFLERLRHKIAAGRKPPIELLSIRHVISMAALHPAKPLLENDRQDIYNPSDHPADPQVVSQQTELMSTDGLVYLGEFFDKLIPVLSSDPSEMGQLVPYVAYLHSLLRDADATSSSRDHDEECAAQQNLARGHQHWLDIVRLLNETIEKRLSHIQCPVVRALVPKMMELLKITLTGPHSAAVAAMDKHRQLHPTLPPSFTADAVAYEWRFDTDLKFIKCGQMQLRVHAVMSMCLNLVAIFKQNPSQSPILRHMGEYLLRSNLMDYIMGPNSHPELIQECANIIGFLFVTKLYTQDHTDRLWQCLTASADARFSEALMRALPSILHVLGEEELCQFLSKLEATSAEQLTGPVRAAWSFVMDHWFQKISQNPTKVTYQPYRLCIRLFREMYMRGTPRPTAELHGMIANCFDKFLRIVTDEVRGEIYRSCMDDLTQRRQTTLGSLWVLHMLAVRRSIFIYNLGQVPDKALAELYINEIADAVDAASSENSQPVLSGSANLPRREVLYYLISQHGSNIDHATAVRLWENTVGHRTLCARDREAGWKILQNFASLGNPNAFVQECLTKHIGSLPPECYCDGALQFIKQETLAQTKETDEFNLEDGDNVNNTCIEHLWRIVLGAPDKNLAERAMQVLAVEVYLDNTALQDCTPLKMRKVHSALIERCFQQLKAAANELTLASGEAHSDSDAVMELRGDRNTTKDAERLFLRSLHLLQHFLQEYQSRPRFAAPVLSSLVAKEPAATIAGESAQLHYQSFDNGHQTEVLPLEIGQKNTAASLLASIQEQTGFPNYGAFVKGQAFLPSEEDMRLSLDQLKLTNCLILVRKEHSGNEANLRFGPSCSHAQIEVMNHFRDLWQFLDLPEALALDTYHLLKQLPADMEVILGPVSSLPKTHDQLFPSGHYLRSLYAAHAFSAYKTLLDRMHVRELDAEDGVSDSRLALSHPYADIRSSVIAALVRALIDRESIVPSGDKLHKSLLASLLHALHIWLEDCGEVLEAYSFDSMGITSAEPIVAVLTETLASNDALALDVCRSGLAVILRLCLLDSAFCDRVSAQSDVVGILAKLLLSHSQKSFRQTTGEVLATFFKEQMQAIRSLSKPFAEMRLDTVRRVGKLVLPKLCQLIPEATNVPSRSEDFFQAILSLFSILPGRMADFVDMENLAVGVGELLLIQETTECVTNPLTCDNVLQGLVITLDICLKQDQSLARSDAFPRAGLCAIILELVKADDSVLADILHSLNEALPYIEPDEDLRYTFYDMPNPFDPSRALRASSGYVGLRNLANTCYLNSLVTQLFMNPEFRAFMLKAKQKSTTDSQHLLTETKKVFGYMQETYQRFVDPSALVYSIKTYENTHIDIGQQMDVDEFYNLIFDRWEGQMVDATERKNLRSFYGGQLVQQIKSQECDHISEVFEPFQAIQVDVQGKTCLQESLQAYIDGEMLEGDNQYKCSTCDRHVDAVKRSCLKDLPDNIIFHLKRFDFNLQTLQRNKVYGRFSFPLEIDLNPFTVEHLSDPSSSSEDKFELVGVLVHAGTAESGHYYSYARERPSGTQPPKWIEFNDESATPWDPALLEDATFGAAAEPGSNAKMYSAYMLFYQRKASLLRQQQETIEQALQLPLRVPMGNGLKEYILEDNTQLLRRHCLFEHSHATLVKSIFEHAATGLGMMHGDDELTVEGQTPMTTTSGISPVLLFDVALTHLDQVVTRRKDAPNFEIFSNALDKALSTSKEAAYIYYRYFHLRPHPFRAIVQRNHCARVRIETGAQFLRVVEHIALSTPSRYLSSSEYADSPNEIPVVRRSFEDTRALREDGVPVLRGVMDVVECMWRYFQSHPRSWNECFGFIHAWAEFGEREVAHLLSEDFLYRLVRIIAADDSDPELPENYARMLRNIERRRTVSYEEIIGTIEYLLRSMEPEIGPASITESASERLAEDPPFSWTSSEVSLLHYHPRHDGTSFFVERLIGIQQNPRATTSIVGWLASTSLPMSKTVHQTLQANLDPKESSDYLTAFLAAAADFVILSAYVDEAQRFLTFLATRTSRYDTVDLTLLLQFFVRVLGDPEADEDVVNHCIKIMPLWVPSLLIHGRETVQRATLRLVHRKLLIHWADDQIDDEVEQLRKDAAVIVYGLAVACMDHVSGIAAEGNQQLTQSSVELVLQLIEGCRQLVTEELMGAEAAARLDDMAQALALEIPHLVADDEIEEDHTDQDVAVP
ncbi:ubiquitin carboxyl-terminal hydrolase 34 [Emericellopsis cladophorae]|uniref:Ubiquitin carboxyl-terminal hydrolase 34 n=1 Tax=Emericellopsis cladophorae TaxID=2686198 RepID=A0A9P9XVI9_9HYPO|nr:ubiquitin carboxyl-terminal hydrolase 34 [Emericellopsis cladophorae]KAI6778403.1 ubiquitin carboxyl-terminal hydrolase 34 [Emericellopsis cladophorae]